MALGRLHPHVLTVSGRVAPSTLRLVDRDLSQAAVGNALWCFLASSPDDLAPGQSFDQLFSLTQSGLVVPLTRARCTVLSIHHDPGRFYDLAFYRENPQFKQLWGWRPLGLLHFEDGFPIEISGFYEQEIERWQCSHASFSLSDSNTFKTLNVDEPDLGVDGIREYLHALSAWASRDERIHEFLLAYPGSIHDADPRLNDSRWKFELLPSREDEWQNALRSRAAEEFRVNEAQFNKLFMLLERVWKAPVSRVWRVTQRPLEIYLGYVYEVWIFEVADEIYCLHLNWSV